MPSPIRRVFFSECVFDVWENVYEPAEDSFLLAGNIKVKDSEEVLDVGTGCGILGIVAASRSARVIAVDVNPYAVRCAKENAKKNSVNDRMFFVQGDLFAPLRIGEKFDLILFNAPYLPTKPQKSVSWIERAWAGGANGRQIIDRFICESTRYLKCTGRVFLLQSTLSDSDRTVDDFESMGLKARIVATQTLPFFESIVLIEAKL